MTVLAVALAWLGVRGVVRGALFDRPGEGTPAVGPVVRTSPSPPGGALPGGSPSAGSTTSPEPTSERPTRRPAKSAPRSSQRPPGARDGENVRSYTMRGGRVVLGLTPKRARLISATPNPGYETKVSQASGWLRVDFFKGDRTSSLIATFYAHAPKVQVYEY